MNGCTVCDGLGRLLAFGAVPVVVPCPECAGLNITPASAEDATLLAVEVFPGRWLVTSDEHEYDVSRVRVS